MDGTEGNLQQLTSYGSVTLQPGETVGTLPGLLSTGIEPEIRN